VVARWYQNASYAIHLFFCALDGTCTAFEVPGFQQTFAMGINASGEITGEYSTAAGWSHGFSRAIDGTIITLTRRAHLNRTPTRSLSRLVLLGRSPVGTLTRNSLCTAFSEYHTEVLI
jgi:hypothetical protein